MNHTAKVDFTEFDNTIEVSWHIEDVKMLDESLSDQQARDILQIVKEHHNASVGINWDVLQTSIDIYKEARNIK